MKKVKRVAAIVFILILTCLCVPGCTVSKSKEDSSDKEIKEASSQNAKLEQATIYVFVAASLHNAMTEIQELYHKQQPNVTIVLNPDSSGALKTQIEQGAACDVFFSAATKQMSELEASGLVKSSSILNLLENQVVLIKPKGLATAVKSFETVPLAKNIALAGEDVPVGTYAREIFTNLGIINKVMGMEINQGANVSAVLAAVSEGSNEIGVVYATDAASVSDQVEIIAAAPSGSLKTPVMYPAALVNNAEASAQQKEAAEDFLSYLKTDEAMRVFTKYGFIKAE